MTKDQLKIWDRLFGTFILIHWIHYTPNLTHCVCITHMLYMYSIHFGMIIF